MSYKYIRNRMLVTALLISRVSLFPVLMTILLTTPAKLQTTRNPVG